MKNILIAGYGFVGQAVHYSLTKHDTVESDFVIDIFDLDKGRECNLSADYDFVFVCVPTPSNEDGSCNYAVVAEYVKLFRNHTGLIIRSTIPPSAVNELLSINSKLVYMPEFLREQSFKHDCINPQHILIGCNDLIVAGNVKCMLMDTQINPESLQRIKNVDPITASLFKYTANTFLAMKVVFMHELFKVCDENGYNWNELVSVMHADPRLGNSHFSAPGNHGFGFAGSCFPKDTSAFVKETGDSLSLLAAVIESNSNLRKSNVQK